MSTISLPVWLAGALLVSLFLAGAIAALRPSRPAATQEARMFLASGLALLALATVIELLLRELSDGDSGGGGIVTFTAGLLMLLVAWQTHRRQRGGNTDPARFSWIEKSNLLMGGTMVGVYGWYFWRSAGASLEQAVPLFIGAVVAVVVIAIIGHIILALTHFPKKDLDTSRDERDQMVALLATRNASIVLTLGLWLILALLLLPADTLTRLNVAFAALMGAEVVRSASLAWYYRRGIH